MAHTLQLLCPNGDFACVVISHFVKGVRVHLQDEKSIAHITIWAKDILEIDCDLLDETSALKQAQKYNRKLKQMPSMVFLVLITALEPCDSIPHLAFAALRNIGDALKTQLESLRDKVREKNDSVAFKMLVGVHND
jgi:hypothetical protein